MIWNVMIWYEVIWCDLVYYDMLWYDMMWSCFIWYDMAWYDMLCYDMILYDIIRYDLIWYDMMCIFFLNAIHITLMFWFGQFSFQSQLNASDNVGSHDNEVNNMAPTTQVGHNLTW